MNLNSQPQPVTRPTPNPQPTLFAALPRQLPILKSGPEDEPKVLIKH